MEVVENGNGATGDGDDKKAESRPGWELDFTEIEVISTLYRGESSRVFRGKYRGQIVAIKELLQSNVKDITEQISEFKKEIEVMSTVRNTSVVYFFGATVQPSLSLVTELMEYSICDILQRKDLPFPYDWNLVLKLAIESAKAVHTLHCEKPPIIHCNLKSTKLLLDTTLRVKIAGFGLSVFKTRRINVTTSQPRESHCYVAPEVFKGQGSTTKSDIFSFGIILWELATRCVVGSWCQPYTDIPNTKYDHIWLKAVGNGLRPTLHPTIPKQLSSLIQRCWDQNPDVRPTFNSIIAELEAVLGP